MKSETFNKAADILEQLSSLTRHRDHLIDLIESKEKYTFIFTGSIIASERLETEFMPISVYEFVEKYIQALTAKIQTIEKEFDNL